jgi:hypothetical protein
MRIVFVRWFVPKELLKSQKISSCQMDYSSLCNVINKKKVNLENLKLEKNKTNLALSKGF